MNVRQEIYEKVEELLQEATDWDDPMRPSMLASKICDVFEKVLKEQISCEPS